jgi:hypothetical protein
MMPVLAQALEVSNNQLGLGVITALLAQHFVLRKYIRQQAGVKDVSTTEISGQPLHFVKDETPMTLSAHAAVCGPLGGRVLTLEREVKEIRSAMAKDKIDIIEAGETRMRKIHERVDTVLHAVARVEGAIEQMRSDHR